MQAAEEDMEALVVKVSDRILTLQLYACISIEFRPLTISFIIRPCGNTFLVGPKNYSLHREPKEGDVVSFSFDHHHRRAMPANPQVYRIRADVNWDHVLQNSRYLKGITCLGNFAYAS